LATDDGHVAYWLGFNRVKGIGPIRLRALIHHFGDVDRAWNASPAALRQAGILDERTIDSLTQTRLHSDLDAELRDLERWGASVVLFDDARYPALLREISDPPPLLFVRGTLTEADQQALAVVGTRRATSYGKAMTQQLVEALVGAGYSIVSGLALGIDSAAHLAALNAGGRTIAVLPCGIDRIYPPEHRKLAEAVAAQGALITEFSPGTAPERWNFPPRNRIVSGMARGVLIVEAPAHSGALVTADMALDQGRDVFAVPGNALSPSSEGTNSLIRSGAKLVTQAEDILEELRSPMGRTERAPEKATERGKSTSTPKAAPQPVIPSYTPADATEAGILACLEGVTEPSAGEKGMHIDELARATQLDIVQVIRSVTLLEMKGVIRQTSPMHFVLSRRMGTL